MKRMVAAAITGAALIALAGPAAAGPVTLSNAQMDGVTAGSAGMDGFGSSTFAASSSHSLVVGSGYASASAKAVDYNGCFCGGFSATQTSTKAAGHGIIYAGAQAQAGTQPMVWHDSIN
ncbi:MAG TPA: hypothetical protein VKA48_03410 [Gammaproteobacteria bacterium]|nr:hypothetical protein [Gammaproteobacteria bacterium]